MATKSNKDYPECSRGLVFFHEIVQNFSCLNDPWNCNSTALLPSTDQNYPYFPVDKEETYDLHNLNEKLKCAMNIVDNACSMFSLEKIKTPRYRTKKGSKLPSVICVENESSDRQSCDDEERDYHSIKFIDEHKNIPTSHTHMSTVCSTVSNYFGDDTDVSSHPNQDRHNTIETFILTRSVSSITYASCFDSDERLSYDSDERDELQILLDDNEWSLTSESKSKENQVCLDLNLSQSNGDQEMNSKGQSKDSLLSYDGDENSLNDVVSLTANSEVDEVLITIICSDEASSIADWNVD
jgi:hypothetical protein